MDQTFFRRLFRRSPKAPLESTETRAERGSAEAQFHLGLRCANAGGPQDYAQAALWYLKAAEQNHALAQFNLGIMYASGQGVSRNDTEARAWFDKSARLGDAGAQHRLGQSHHGASVRGLPQDVTESRIEAYKWFDLAAAQGYRDSENERDTVGLKMSHQDMAEATQRVVNFTLSIRGNPASQ